MDAVYAMDATGTLIRAGSDFDPSPRTTTANAVSLSDIVSALSFALDLTEGAMPGHAVRSCLLGMRIAKALDLPVDERSNLYYALLLKDIGCSSNAARLNEIAGAGGRGTCCQVRDWASSSRTAIGALWARAFPGVLPQAQGTDDTSLQRKRNQPAKNCGCVERSARIIAKIGLSQEVALIVRHLDEHWDGSGGPGHLRGNEISLGGRIASIAQNLDVFYTRYGADAAMAVLKKRKGRWFDPQLVKVAVSLHRKGNLWSGRAAGFDRDDVLALDPDLSGGATVMQIDNVCHAFAEVVDARSSFTYAHSVGVMRAAGMIARQLGLGADRQQLVYRAALLHDIGKLHVPNSILDKPGKLDAGEWKVVREHPMLTQRILERITKFEAIARTASQHHERLDGSGYPDGLRAEQLSMEARVIAVADVYGALSEDRPYRRAMSEGEIISIMRADVPHKLDPECFEALLGALKHTKGVVRCANGEILTSSSTRRAVPAFVPAS